MSMSPLFRRRPPDPDETVVVTPPEERYVEREEVVEEPPRRPPIIWPWLLLLLAAVLLGLGALWYFTREDDKEVVPAVVGLSVEEATERLTNDGFRTEIEQEPNPRPRGQVFAQRPGGGSQLEEGEAVALFVSTGPRRVNVPGVIGLEAEEARERLRDANLQVRERRVFSDERPGTVIAQDPRGGERVAPRSSVRINVSKGRDRVEVPLVVGETADDAGSILRRAGFEARPFDVPSAEPAGTVVAQNPPPGAQAARGDTVRINVSTGEGGDAGGGAVSAQVEVPDAVGQRLAAAQDQLQEAGLVARVAFVPSQEPEGTVVAQNPTPGTSARRGSSVRLNV
jgi:eukaryotic-like serine/threonine-protein kinase